jgi:hypothetical protein
MRIINDIKLDFKDVLFVPHRSALESRNDVDLNRKFVFKHSTWTYNGIPIMASNMDGVGTMQMADKLSAKGIFTCLVKHYSTDDLLNFFNDISDRDRLGMRLKNTAYSMGTSDQDLEKYKAFQSRTTFDPRYICIDVANGYTQKFIDFIKRFREDNPDPVIIAGNVVTGDMTEALIFAGVDVVKVGIGPGCFVADSLILTRYGLKRIFDIEIGTEVLTHKNRLRKVLHKFEFKDKDILLKINNIKCTPNHEFYVVNKSDREFLTDDNIYDYGYWVSADKLDKDIHLLLRSTTRS